MTQFCPADQLERTEDGRWRCRICGLSTAVTDRPAHRVFRLCGMVRQPRKPRGPGLGDRVAVVLDRIGVTKERAARWMLWLGFVRRDDCGCGCDQRRAWLNKFGRRFWPAMKAWLSAEFVGVTAFRRSPTRPRSRPGQSPPESHK